MKLRAVTVRRALALVGSAAIATFVAVAIPSPASAHHPIVRGAPQCDAATGTWKVTWTVENSESDLAGKITAVNLSPTTSTVTNISVGATLPTSRQGGLNGVQVLPGNTRQASLSVTAFWQRPGYSVTRSASAAVELQGTCEIPQEPKPAAAFASHCDGSVITTLMNGADATKAASFKVTGGNGFAQEAKVDPNASTTIVVPASNAEKIVVTAGRTKVAEGSFADPQDCAVPQTTVATSCDSLSLSVSNPDGGRSVLGTLTPSTGEAFSFTLQPGQEASHSFAGSAGLTVAMKVTGLDDETVSWAKAEACEPALPDTGASLTTAITSGAVLVVLGAGILFFFRRRRGAHARF